MRSISRRGFMAGAAGAGLGAVPFSIWGDRQAQAQAQAQAQVPVTRHDVSTSQGQVMVEKYARAVAKMMDRTVIPEGNPTSWLFQFYSHAVDGNRTKPGEIARIYAGAAPADPHRLLAQAMWNTCQAHGMDGLPQDERMFLPWHRMFLYNFERIIRKILADDTFTLPYWDYTTAGKRAIPEQFRMPNHPVFKALFRDNRNDGVNAGQPIDQNRPASPLNLAALRERDYAPRGVVPGFNQSLDFGLHGAVHVLVGDSTNMGQVPFAARDPIFWLHHANIDRLWASWNKGGRLNPTGTWLTQSFTFADENAARVDPVVNDFVDTEKLLAGPYKYDKLEPVPPLPPTPANVMLVAAAPSIIANQVQPGTINLSSSTPVEVPLAPAAVPMSTHLEAGGQNKRVYLVLQNLQAQAQPGVLYDVYLDPPSASPSSPSDAPVGTINFFGAGGHGADHGAAGGQSTRYSFDVTDSVKAASVSSGAPKVRIAPVGTPVANARPVVGAVSLVLQ